MVDVEDGRTLSIKGQVHHVDEDGTRHEKHVRRSIRLPQDADTQLISTRYDDGRAVVEVPRGSPATSAEAEAAALAAFVHGAARTGGTNLERILEVFAPDERLKPVTHHITAAMYHTLAGDEAWEQVRARAPPLPPLSPSTAIPALRPTSSRS